jgi:hypothetical protein
VTTNLAKKAWSTLPDLRDREGYELINNGKPSFRPAKRRVSWNNGVRVILIPRREEYEATEIGDLIWWRDVDYAGFKEGAVQELREVMMTKQIDSKAAIAYLYQPGETEATDEYDAPRESNDVDSTAEATIEEEKPARNLEVGLQSTTMSPSALVRKAGFFRTEDSRIFNQEHLRSERRCESCAEQYETSLDDCEDGLAYCFKCSSNDDMTCTTACVSTETMDGGEIVF